MNSTMNYAVSVQSQGISPDAMGQGLTGNHALSKNALGEENSFFSMIQNLAENSAVAGQEVVSSQDSKDNQISSEELLQAFAAMLAASTEGSSILQMSGQENLKESFVQGITRNSENLLTSLKEALDSGSAISLTHNGIIQNQRVESKLEEVQSLLKANGDSVLAQESQGTATNTATRQVSADRAEQLENGSMPMAQDYGQLLAEKTDIALNLTAYPNHQGAIDNISAGESREIGQSHWSEQLDQNFVSALQNSQQNQIEDVNKEIRKGQNLWSEGLDQNFISTVQNSWQQSVGELKRTANTASQEFQQNQIENVSADGTTVQVPQNQLSERLDGILKPSIKSLQNVSVERYQTDDVHFSGKKVISSLEQLSENMGITSTKENQQLSKGESESFSFQRQLFEAVRTAKSRMQNGGMDQDDNAEDTMPEPKLLNMTSQPMTRVSGDTAVTPSDTVSLQENSILEQVTAGISKSVQAGKNEVTMTLKPEALGEIVIKIVEEEGKKTLHIVTASTQTAKMINDELASLREAVRPLQVEVHEAVQKTPEAPQSFLQQFDLSGHQFGQQKQAFSWQTHKTVYHGEESFEDELQNDSQPLLEQSGMNIYV